MRLPMDTRLNAAQISGLLSALVTVVLLAAPLWSATPGLLPAAGVVLFAIADCLFHGAGGSGAR